MNALAQDLPSIDVTSYQGDWYVIGFKPSFLDKKWMNVRESYSWDFEKQQFNVETRYTKKAKGREHTIRQKLLPTDSISSARWIARIWWFINADYVIYKIAPDYSYVVVGHPKQKYVYIMARKPTMDPKLYDQLMDFCVSIGYKKDEIQPCHHD